MKTMKALAVAAIALLGFGGPALATPIIGLEMAESGFTTFSTSGTTDPLIVNQSYGTFSVNTEVTTLTTDPLALNLNSTNISTSTGGTLVLTASANNLTAPSGLVDWLSQLTGLLTFGSDVTISLNTYLDSTNTLFGMDTPIDVGNLSQSPLVGVPFAISDTPGLIVGTNIPFALTEVLTINSPGTSFLGSDGSVTGTCPPGLPGCTQNPPTDVPEPGSLALLGTAMLGLGGTCVIRRRRKRHGHTEVAAA